MAHVYVANPTGNTFDFGTEALLLEDFRPKVNGGIFRGKCGGVLEEEYADFSEFDIHEVLDLDDIEIDLRDYQSPLDASGEKYLSWLDTQFKNLTDWGSDVNDNKKKEEEKGKK